MWNKVFLCFWISKKDNINGGSRDRINMLQTDLIGSFIVRQLFYNLLMSHQCIRVMESLVLSYNLIIRISEFENNYKKE